MYAELLPPPGMIVGTGVTFGGIVGVISGGAVGAGVISAMLSTAVSE